MNHAAVEDMLQRRLTGFVKKDRIKAVITRLNPLVEEYHALREQNAGLIRALRSRDMEITQRITDLRDRSSGDAPREHALPDGDPR
jgi:hypothetical protein